MGGLLLQQVDLPDFSGLWVCKNTWGLDEFLKRTGFSRLERMLAKKAPWPQWDFEQRGSHLTFVNRSACGDIREEFEVDGPPYKTRDGWNQVMISRAVWEGRRLVIKREGPQGKFREDRWVDDLGQLQFRLQAIDGRAPEAAWGRTFVRNFS